MIESLCEFVAAGGGGGWRARGVEEENGWRKGGAGGGEEGGKGAWRPMHARGAADGTPGGKEDRWRTQAEIEKEKETPGLKRGPGEASKAGGNQEVPPEKLKLYYTDPQGDVQGPFPGADIMSWLELNYFGLDLPVRRDDAPPDTPYQPLGTVMPHLKKKTVVPPGFKPPTASAEDREGSKELGAAGGGEEKKNGQAEVKGVEPQQEDTSQKVQDAKVSEISKPAKALKAAKEPLPQVKKTGALGSASQVPGTSNSEQPPPTPCQHRGPEFRLLVCRGCPAGSHDIRPVEVSRAP